MTPRPLSERVAGLKTGGMWAQSGGVYFPSASSCHGYLHFHAYKKSVIPYWTMYRGQSADDQNNTLIP